MWVISQFTPLAIHPRLSPHRPLLLNPCPTLVVINKIQLLFKAVATTGTQVTVHIRQINHRVITEHRTEANITMLTDIGNTVTVIDTALRNMVIEEIEEEALTVQGD